MSHDRKRPLGAGWGPALALVSLGAGLYAGAGGCDRHGRSREPEAEGMERDVVFVTDGAWTGPGVASRRGFSGTLGKPTLRVLGTRPTRGPVSLSIVLPSASEVSVQLFDVGGRIVRTLLNGYREAGAHEVS